MRTLTRLPVPRKGKDAFYQTITSMGEPIRLLHNAHIGYGGFLLKDAKEAIVTVGQSLMVGYVDRRWREIGRTA